MGYAIATEIKRFHQLLKRAGLYYTVRQDIPHTGVLVPRGDKASDPKPIGLAFMGLTHGNEWAGVAVINGVLEHILAHGIKLHFPVAFILGNPDAALLDKRFLERDLNRSFGRTGGTSLEERRARELEPLLEKTAYLVDFHQTMQPSDRPFFIFPYRFSAFNFALSIAPQQTIVTHWGHSFSADGRCTDEFVNDHGGVGITIELGQNGFNPYQIAVGIESAMWAITVTSSALGGRGLERIAKERTTAAPEVFTWAEILPWPKQGLVVLEEGLTNFRKIEKGQKIGEVDGAPITAGMAGPILFPKYLSRDQQLSALSRPSELVRIMRPVRSEELSELKMP